MVSEKEIQKEMREHPWASKELARRIAEDHAKRKTTTKEGKRLYMKSYMRERRKVLKVPNIMEALGVRMEKRKK